jgi:metal-sulfur cluster biosynthetic enzyme
MQEHDKIYETLKKVYDPELGINIVDLGLILQVNYYHEPKSIDIAMTLTTQGCPMGEVIIDNAYDVLADSFPFVNITIHLVWEPEWSVERMTPEGRQLLSIS